MNILELSNKKITKNQLKDIQNDISVKTLILERKDFITIDDKKLNYDGYKLCKIIFKNNNHIFVFVKEEDFL